VFVPDPLALGQRQELAAIEAATGPQIQVLNDGRFPEPGHPHSADLLSLLAKVPFSVQKQPEPFFERQSPVLAAFHLLLPMRVKFGFGHRFSQWLTWPRGQKYITSVAEREVLSHGAAIHHAAEKRKILKVERAIMLNECLVSRCYKAHMWQLAQKLEPIYRTLVSPGFEQSLKCIQEQLPLLKIKKYRSGTKVFDWTIPMSWTLKEGYIEDRKGRRLFDSKKHPFLVGPYSQPFSGVISREELIPHLQTLPHLPKAFALCPSYYAKDWKLGVPHEFKTHLKDKAYRVHIDSQFKAGHLCIGEVYLPGKVKREILISTYLCHPFTANDNMSGVVVAVELFKILSAIKDRYYSYRLIIIPETIGSITFLYHHQKELKNIMGGFVIACCGDRGGITFKKSRVGNSLMDRAAIKALKERAGKHRILDYYLTGSDERQFNAPGTRLPMATIMRTPPSEFIEYHSSFDNLSCITAENLADTLQFTLDTLFIIDNNRTYVNRYRTEPFLTGIGIHKQIHVGRFGVFNKTRSGMDSGQLNQIIIHETDGEQDLLSIADKYQCSFRDVNERSQVFEAAGLIKHASNQKKRT
jgi:aminopeptidase-like protein